MHLRRANKGDDANKESNWIANYEDKYSKIMSRLTDLKDKHKIEYSELFRYQ